MAAVGAGHIMVVEVLLLHKEIQFEMNDSYGMTAVFHTCNHGLSRVGDQHGYFLSQLQLEMTWRAWPGTGPCPFSGSKPMKSCVTAV